MADQATEYLDLDDGLTRVRGNMTLFKQMLNLFLVSEEFQAFEDAIESNDNKMAEAKIHGIKGLSGNLSMPALFSTSSILNEQLRTGEADPVTLAEYREAYKKTREYIVDFMAADNT